MAGRTFSAACLEELEQAGFAEPVGGQLRTAGDPVKAFQKEPLGILRCARLAVCRELAVEEETERAMLTQAEQLKHAEREQVFEELCKLLLSAKAEDLLRFGPILAAAIPELKPMIGFDQRSPHHAYDLFTHTALVTAGVPADLALRWAGLLHDIGKVPTFTRDETGRGHFHGHAPRGAEMAEEVLRRLNAPAALREQAVTLIANHMTKLPPEKEPLRSWLDRLGWETTEKLLYLQEADMGSKGMGKPAELAQFSRLRELLEEIRAENSEN